MVRPIPPEGVEYPIEVCGRERLDLWSDSRD
jgi:hypothetical protein